MKVLVRFYTQKSCRTVWWCLAIHHLPAKWEVADDTATLTMKLEEENLKKKGGNLTYITVTEGRQW